MSMGFQMRLWSCVPQRPQMPPPRNPQVQILRRRNAFCILLKEGEDGRHIVVDTRTVRDRDKLFFSFVLNIFTLQLLCLYSIDVKYYV